MDQRTQTTRTADSDLTAKAVSEKWILPLQVGGHNYQWVFTENMTRLISVLKHFIRKEVAGPLGFKEYLFPRLVPEEVLGETGWLTYHAPEAWHVSQKREFRFDLLDKPTVFDKKEKFKPSQIDFVLDPIQCVSLYYAYYDKEIDPKSLPIKVFEDQGGWTWRYEVLDSLNGLFKSIEFLRTEFVWIANQTEAESTRNEALLATSNMIRKLGIETAFGEGDSCFVESVKENNLNYQKTTQNLKDLSAEPTVDLLCKRTDGSWSEICSGSRYSIITKRFKIQCSNKTELWSGCLGVGINRMVVIFLEKYGFVPEQWPVSIKQIWAKSKELPL